ncbi:DEAD/DEAH box helicase [Auritidibacter ignavus]|uniref:DEAD/DEAH box helicase n=1 Tax=Auritidibacter ignavus TaxID=678932 RepID=UPI00244B2331|nr:DEAD/DEAH box helicase [Auritidibacter ignavus]WGH91334.1 DEAD/DEAH box helicase [Auritidibacter ignavus]
MTEADQHLSPAERYALDAKRRRQARTPLGEFSASLGFQLDEFQQQACQYLQQGHSVLVAAPTGAGKTIVGEFAIHLAQSSGLKAFYTTPIKALSNQKYTDLVQRYGAAQVGLLTGDVARNPDAPIVVMTTEVLRNMLYADAEPLRNLGYVVMDEVHYLADRFRGAVWEEVIIHLPEHVALVSLSATVSNAEEFGAWLDTVRGSTKVVVSEHRPVPLWQHVMAGKNLYDLFATTGEGVEKPKLNPELAKIASEQQRAGQPAHWGKPGSGKRGRGGKRGKGGKGSAYRFRSHTSQHRHNPGPRAQSMATQTRTSRPTMVRVLEREALLPCITFIFSRAGCDAAVEQCLQTGLDLTTPAEKRAIEDLVDQAGATLPEHDRDVLGFWGWRDGLKRGFAAHHAGMLPPFKEVVEELFAAGLVKVVFATETLALGINMPARTVVLEKLVKFNGETHAPITPGEYTQLTGRAGRRGIDIEGHAVVMWSDHRFEPHQVVGLASRRTYPLNSSFKPTYNMAVNLLAVYGLDTARGILESSFAQFQADRSVVGLAQQVKEQEKSLEGYRQAMSCHLGDFTEYAALRRELAAAEKSASRVKKRARRDAEEQSLTRLVVGDIIEVTGPRKFGVCTVVSTAGNPHNPRVAVITHKGQFRRVGTDDLAEPVEPIGSVNLPKNLLAKTPTQRKTIASWAREALRRNQKPRPREEITGFRYRDESAIERVEELRAMLRAHPCDTCADREEHARWANRWATLRSETDRLISTIDSRTNTIATTFERILGLLADYDYVDLETETLTKPGHVLRRIYGERDLLTALLLQDGVTDTMSPEDLAGLAALLVFEGSEEELIVQPDMPTPALTEALDASDAIWYQLQDAESQASLKVTPQPHPGLVWPVFRWVRGQSLTLCLSGTTLAAGDFVRWARQVIDMLDQLAKASPDADFSRRCFKAKDLVNRGIVSYSASPDPLGEDGPDPLDSLESDEPTGTTDETR